MLRLVTVLLLVTLVTVKGASVEERLSRLEEEVSAVRRQVSLGQQAATSAAFSARLAEDTTMNDGAVLFSVVDLNVGGGYDGSTGVFEPPVDGVYYLSVYAITTTDEGPIFIKSNEDVLCSGYVDGTSHDTATCSAIAELSTEDSVRVTGESDSPATIRAPESGFLGHVIESGIAGTHK